MNKVKLILTFVVIIGIIIGALYWISTNASRAKAAKLEHINKGFGYSKGLIVQKKSYKGHTIQVKYEIEGKKYKYTGGWDRNPKNLGDGDSIMFRYALDAPELIITELDDGY